MRAAGYYWIKVYNEWIVAYYSGNYSQFAWSIIGDNDPLFNDQIQEINENEIKRNA